MYPFALPDPVTFLELVRDPDFLLELRTWDYILEWLELQQPEELNYARPIIVNIARRLTDHPRLLYGLNCILQPHYRIECMTTVPRVTSYVLIAKGHCEIHSSNHLDVSSTSNSLSTDFPSTREDLEGLLNHTDRWQETVGAITESQRLACIAQVLQEIIEDPSLEEAYRQSARKWLYRLGKAGILPPSIFIHFVTPPPAYESIIERSEHGELCDAHKITVNSVPLCFRILRQWQTSDSDKIYHQFCRELSVWRQLKHPNILPLIGATTEAFPRRYCFIVPWFLHGSIMSYLETYPNHDRYLAISQIVDGVNYLHGLDPPVSHKDLKGENVLVRSDRVCVITDFGLSGALDTQRSKSTAALGTMSWMAPELFNEDDYEHLPPDARPRDVYSLGCTIAQILTGKAPRFIMLSVIKGKQPSLPPSRTSGWHQDELHLWDLVRQCIEFEPEDRPLIQEVKKHLEAVRQSEPCCFESTPPPPRKVDKRRLISWIKSHSQSFALRSPPRIPPTPSSSALTPAWRSVPESIKKRKKKAEMASFPPPLSDVGQSWATWQPPAPAPAHPSSVQSWATWRPPSSDIYVQGRESQGLSEPQRKKGNSVTFPPPLSDVAESWADWEPPSPNRYVAGRESPGLFGPRTPSPVLVPGRESPGLFGPRTPSPDFEAIRSVAVE